MQTILQFGNTSTIQEWSNFKGILKNAGKQQADHSQADGASLLIDHLTKQLQGASVIKMWELTNEVIDLKFENINFKQAV